ncbi:MAG TPA: cytochrome ubiquinol oxidase subunit I [Actinomycetota bacterium]|nr:cytochrome ubiquinol oxidase subunit I [Actinomycetota bacterium]
MDALDLSRWQFAITIAFHFLFVPLSIGLAFLVAVMQTAWYRTEKPVYLRMTKFWGRLFLINFALGVVTGIVQEFQFGMNWSTYSRFVGDVFGAPLAIEGLAAFFLESTFLGLWIFGWERLSRRLHLATIWLVAFGATISALWILAANAWMQHPVGFAMDPATGRAQMRNFFAMLTNPVLAAQFPHTVLAALTTGGMFVIGVSGYHLLRAREADLFTRSARIALVVTFVASIGIAFTGHWQAQQMTRYQPMKMAAAEALWDTEQGPGFSLFAVGDIENGRNHINVQLPHMLSVLATNRWNGTVEGINDLQARFEQEYGPGSYLPVVGLMYWTFRLMVGAGLLMIVLTLAGLWLMRRRSLGRARWFQRAAPIAIALPIAANLLGWTFTEMGRQPWVVYGLLKTSAAGSPSVGTAFVLATLIGFTLIYGLLAGIDVFLLAKYSRTEPAANVGIGAEAY